MADNQAEQKAEEQSEDFERHLRQASEAILDLVELIHRAGDCQSVSKRMLEDQEAFAEQALGHVLLITPELRAFKGVVRVLKAGKK